MEEKTIVDFEKTYGKDIEELAQIKRLLDEYGKREKEIKERLEDAMNELGLTSVDLSNGYQLVKVKDSSSVSIDSKLLKDTDAGMYEYIISKYSKTNYRKGYVTLKTNGK